MISTQVLAAGKIYRTSAKFFAQQTGMWQLTGCAVVELDTDEEWIMPNLLDVVVVETGVSTPLPAVPERSNSTVFTREASPKPSQPDVFASPSDAPPSTNSSASNLLDLSSAGIAAQEAVFAAPPPADRLYVDVTTTPPPGAVDTGAGLPLGAGHAAARRHAAAAAARDRARADAVAGSAAATAAGGTAYAPPPPPPPPPAGDAFDLFGSDIADHSFMAESAVSEISAVSPSRRRREHYQRRRSRRRPFRRARPLFRRPRPRRRRRRRRPPPTCSPTIRCREAALARRRRLPRRTVRAGANIDVLIITNATADENGDVRPPQILVRGPEPQPQNRSRPPVLSSTNHPAHEGFGDAHPCLAVRDRFRAHRAEPLLEPLEAPRDVRARGRGRLRGVARRQRRARRRGGRRVLARARSSRSAVARLASARANDSRSRSTSLRSSSFSRRSSASGSLATLTAALDRRLAGRSGGRPLAAAGPSSSGGGGGGGDTAAPSSSREGRRGRGIRAVVVAGRRYRRAVVTGRLRAVVAGRARRRLRAGRPPRLRMRIQEHGPRHTK